MSTAGGVFAVHGVFDCRERTEEGHFIAAPEPTFALRFYGVSGYWLRLANGELRAAPASLFAPALVGDALYGLVQRDGGLALWHDGVCEVPEGGLLHAFAPLGDGSIVAAVGRPPSILLRSSEGEWRRLDSPPTWDAPSFHARDGRVAVLSRSISPVDEEALRFPDLQRAEVVLRGYRQKYANVTTLVEPLAPRPGSRFSPAVLVDNDFAGHLFLETPDPRLGYRRSLAITLPSVRGCTEDRADALREAPTTTTYLTAGPAAFTLVDGVPVFAWVEEEGACRYQFIPKVSPDCRDNRPCHDTPPASWRPVITKQRTTLVVRSVGREVVRLPLDEGDGEKPVRFNTGLGMAVGPTRLVIQAMGHWLELDRAWLKEHL